MAVLFLAGKFGKALAERREIENGIVAESLVTPRRFEQLTCGKIREHRRDAPTQRQRQHADKPGAEVAHRLAAQLFEKLLDALGVSGLRTGVARRLHSRRATERGHDQA